MRDIFIFYCAFFIGTFYMLFIIAIFASLRKMPLRVKLAIAIVTLGGIGLICIFWSAATNPRNLDGKRVEAITYSPVDNQCIKINVVFDKEKVQIFTGDAPLKLRTDFVVQPNSSIAMILAHRTIDNLEKIRVLETQHNTFLDVNVVAKECPK